MAQEYDKHPVTGEPGKWRYIGGMGWMNFDESNRRGPRTHYEDGTPVHDFTGNNANKNPNWSIRINDISRFVGQHAGAGRTRLPEDFEFEYLNDPFWRTSQGRQMIHNWAVGNQDLTDIYRQMAEIKTNLRNDVEYQQALAEKANLDARVPATLEAFRNGELDHLLNSKGHVHAIVGHQPGSMEWNMYWKDMREEDKQTVARGYANKGWSLTEPHEMEFGQSDIQSQQQQNGQQADAEEPPGFAVTPPPPPEPSAPITPISPPQPPAGGPTSPQDMPPAVLVEDTFPATNVPAQPNAGQGTGTGMLSPQQPTLDDLFKNVGRGIARSGTWGSGHTGRISGADLQSLARGALDEVRPVAEGWAQNNPEQFQQLQSVANDFRQNAGMFGQDSRQMRETLITALRNKLLG